jgi:ABC-type transport system substrate-binding protein
MLRGEVDMLYEVGADAIDLLEPSSNIRLVTQQRNYAYAVILNVQRQALKDRAFRQALNAAIDREALISDVLKGHGTPALSAVSPHHWAFDSTAPKFQYQPKAVTSSHTFTCVLAEASLERLGLAIQQQLHSVGVHMRLELTTIDDLVKRIGSGDFDAILADAQLGPTLWQQYRFWEPGNARNWGRFRSDLVSASLDQIRDAPTDDAYRAGVAAFQRAIFDDPPAIFLAWSERARAVSTRFDVPIEPGRDILGTLRQWRPIASPQVASRN